MKKDPGNQIVLVPEVIVKGGTLYFCLFTDLGDTDLVAGLLLCHRVEVSLSPPFYAWVFQFAGGMKILSPAEAVEEIKKMAESVMV